MESPTDSTNSIEANDPALCLLDSIHRIQLGFIAEVLLNENVP